MQDVLQHKATSGVVFGHESFKGHEQVVFCHDPETGLKAIIGIHSTVLGPALGGTRMWNYADEGEALRDVLRLSRGMTFKASLAGLNLGGGKAVIIGDARTQKSPELMARFGQFVNSLSGRYITAEDVGINTADMEVVKRHTDHVTGIPVSMGGSGDPSPVTAYGTFVGMKACAQYKWGSDDLAGKRVVVQGIGHVGETLVKYLTGAGAEVFIHDIYPERVEAVAGLYGAKPIAADQVYSMDADIYAPCALGATVNDQTLSVLKAGIIAGAANNQLADEVRHGQMVKERGIIYAPDFMINAGGLINVYSEIARYSAEESMQKTAKIYDTTLRILELAEQKDWTTHEAALYLAQQRIDETALKARG
jgi:leucine dehydrogenase